MLYFQTGIHSLHRSEMVSKFSCMGWPVLIDQFLVAAGESYGERFGVQFRCSKKECCDFESFKNFFKNINEFRGVQVIFGKKKRSGQ